MRPCLQSLWSWIFGQCKKQWNAENYTLQKKHGFYPCKPKDTLNFSGWLVVIWITYRAQYKSKFLHKNKKMLCFMSQYLQLMSYLFSKFYSYVGCHCVDCIKIITVIKNLHCHNLKLQWRWWALHICFYF